MDLVIRDACILEGRELRTVDIGIQGLRLRHLIGPRGRCAELKAAGCLVTPA